jgi:hypothetical protein
MFFSKTLLPIILVSSLFLNGCKKDKEKIKENNKEIAPTFKSILEKKASSNSSKMPLETIRNNEYLSENIKGKPHLQNEEYLRKEINKSFNSLRHTYSKNDTTKLPIYNVSELNLSQLQRIYLMYKHLRDSSFLQDIGKIIEDDVLDVYAEHGGIVVFNKKKIYFKTLESYVKRDTSNNMLYGAPEEAYVLPNLGHFHLHATDNNEDGYADPSDRDIIISYFTTHVNNESHDFLITPINRGTFNIDYYGGNKEINPVIKVFDLGNYTYNTPKIFK